MLHLTNMRPDISYLIGLYTRFNIPPYRAYLDAAHQIFWYFNGTMDLAIP